MALINKLSAIGDAIREKTGKEDLLTLDQMPEEIRGISGDGGGAEVEPLIIARNGQYACSGPIASKYIELFGDTITTQNLSSVQHMFENYSNKTVPFKINFDSTYSGIDLDFLFDGAKQLQELPEMSSNARIAGVRYFLSSCESLRLVPQDYFDNFDWSYASSSLSGYGGYTGGIFNKCYSLRQTPISWLKNTNPKINATSSTFLYGLFSNCYALDEALGIPLIYNTKAYTSNFFINAFAYCHRVKNITFALGENSQPVVLRWKSQIIDLSNYVGYASNTANLLSYNAGLTTKGRVYDDATYQALKDDPDWWTVDIAYSRYNHDSAVATINSLPDTSAYLATAGGTNTIKFKGESGSKTDGGAINTLTEEEIAVATDKGWTITFV